MAKNHTSGKKKKRGIAWWVILLFVGLMIASSWITTQYVASKFGYQSALGWGLKISDFKIYGPFAWIGWCIKWWDIKGLVDEYLTNGMLIMSGGAVFSVLFSAYINYLRTKGEGAPDALHGSAHWATPKEIRESGLICDDGICVGAVDLPKKGFLNKIRGKMERVMLRDNAKTHVLLVAPTRSGKGVGVILPTQFSWRDSILVHDIKSENYALTAGFRHRAGQLILMFNPTCSDGTGARWNPLEEIRTYSIFDVKDAQNIAAMIADPDAKGMEDHWVSTSYKLLTGVILHVVYAREYEGRRNLTSVAQFISSAAEEGDSSGVKGFLTTMAETKHDQDFLMNWRNETGTQTATHPEVLLVAQEMLNKEERELGSVVSSAVTKLGLFSEPLVAKNTKVSDFCVSDLMNLPQAVSCYYVVPPSEKERLRPLTRLFFSFVMRRLTEEMKFDGGTSIESYRHRLLLLIDEMPSLRKLDVLQDGLAYIAGYGMKALLVAQDTIQIKDAYGDKESIVAGCHLRIAYAPNTHDEAKALSEMLGKQTLQYESASHSGSRVGHVLGNVSVSTQLHGRELMTPDELKSMPYSDMVVFASGHSPIRGKKLMYYQMPVFQSRAEMRAPSRISIDFVFNATRYFVWAMVSAEKKGNNVIVWLNQKDRQMLPPVYACLTQEKVKNGELEVTEALFEFVGPDGITSNYQLANEFELQFKEGDIPDLDSEFFVSLRLKNESSYKSVQYTGGFQVVSTKKRAVMKEATKVLGHDVKLQDYEKGSSNFGKIVLVKDGFVIQDEGYGNAVIHLSDRLTKSVAVGDDIFIQYDREGKIGTVRTEWGWEERVRIEKEEEERKLQEAEEDFRFEDPTI